MRTEFLITFPPQPGNKFITHYRMFFLNGVLHFYHLDIGHEPISPSHIIGQSHRAYSLTEKNPQPLESFDILAAGLCCQIFCTCKLSAFTNRGLGRKWNDKEWEREKKRRNSLEWNIKKYVFPIGLVQWDIVQHSTCELPLSGISCLDSFCRQNIAKFTVTKGCRSGC